MTQNIFAGDLEANRLTVKRILDLARAGVLRVPPFQRPLRWRRADHLLLLDSLYRGYPVGTLLLWQRPAEAERVLFGDFSMSAQAISNAQWIVDGQQRITSMVSCFLRDDRPMTRQSSEFAFFFDLNESDFGVVEGPLAAHQIPVNRLADPVSTSMWARETGASMELHRQAEMVGEKLRSYEVPAYVTHAEHDDVLKIIFARTNTAGRPMRQEEVFEALNKGTHRGDSLTARLRDVLTATGFGNVDDGDLQRALVCVAGFNPKDALPKELRSPGAASRWERPTAEALQRTIRFLREEARIPHARAMPYVLPLIILPRFFALYPEPQERNVELLVRWIWRGIAGQSHMATNQQFNPHFKALKASSEGAAAAALVRLVTARRPSILPTSEVYNARGMRTKLELAVLFGLGPRRLDDSVGEILSAVEVFEPEDDKAFDLPRLPVSEVWRKQVAARFLHPQVEGSPGRSFERLIRRASTEQLRSHGITGAMLSVIPKDLPFAPWISADKLVAARAGYIRQLVDQQIDQLARWGEDDDGPGLDELLHGLDDGGGRI